MDFVKVNGKEFYYRGKAHPVFRAGRGLLAEYGAFYAGASGNGQTDQETFARVLGKGGRGPFLIPLF